MNRKKKINQTLKAKAKKANKKLAGTSNKPKYIAKADREKLVNGYSVMDKQALNSQAATLVETLSTNANLG
ncbi:DUF2986 domain-containing protein [Shewanella aestuarii]|uniref:DUF2986 domain-containing protein n=1 Tax=Shewanella aestuarii TaxID=1028752 RepID=A0A6G9QFA6_9GAMM|nr:DUF2986 domain-containing protein [Shewanella aestuarii]QIR13146.1 DUF2986 domain-containing protein [Shewanella aestuarii]